MSQSQVVSFRASGHFLNWIEAQKLEGESVSQAAQRLLKEMSGVYDGHKLYTTSDDSMSTMSTDLSTTSEKVSTPNTESVVSTNTVDTVDKLVAERLDPVMERMAAIEERLGKLRA
jgi:hypothetical protein